MSADEEEICPECGHLIPEDAPMGLCVQCLATELSSDMRGKRTLPEDTATPRKLDAYEIMAQIGEGGFGVVYRAVQKEPFEREVALKILRPWLDAPGVLARFEAERQALALLDHPNIAAIYAAGETEDRRPWFAMEYVAGRALTKFCIEYSLDLQARLRVFRDVCHAVEHAHQRGIIHRDLKPSNILVSMRDGEPVVKLIDFGIAKATQHVLTESTLLTGAQQSLGTPAYMSPEQARSGGVDVDTRTDVYALGVILWELLTDQNPVTSKSSGKTGRPSRTRHRSGEVPEDLDWIVLKAMAEEPERRYGSVAEFSADLDRFSEKKPVRARPPSVGYRLRRFVSRNRYWVSAAVLLALIVVSGALVSLGFAIKADSARAETRRVAGLADLRMAGEAADDARFADCVASLTRALRTDPGNRTAFWKLAHELAYRGCTPPSAEPVVMETGVEEVAALAGNRQLVRDRLERVWICGESERSEIGTAERIKATEDGLHFALLSDGGVEWFSATPVESLGKGEAETVFFVSGNIVLKNGLTCTARSLKTRQVSWKIDLRHEPLVLCDDGGRRLVTANRSGHAQIYSGRSGQMLKHADAGILPRDLATDGRAVVVLTERGDLRYWRPDKDTGFTGDTIDRMRTSVVMDKTGRHVAVLRLDGSLELWRTDEEEMFPVRKDVRFSGGVSRVIFDSNGDRLAAISKDGRVHLLEAASGDPVAAFVFHSRQVTDVSALPEGTGLVTATEDGMVYRFSTERRAALPLIDRDTEAELLYADFSPPGNAINIVDAEVRCRIWRYPTGSTMFPPFRFPDGQLALDSSDGAEILFHRNSESFVMLVDKWFEQSPKTKIEGGIESGRMSRDLKYSLIGAKDGSASLIDNWDSRLIHRWTEFDEVISLVSMTEDGTKGAIASGGEIRILSLVPPFEVLSRCVHGGEIRWMEIDAESRLLASGSTDNSACLWNLETGERVGPKLEHAEYAGSGPFPEAGVFGVFSLKGKRLVTTGSPDHTARVWDTGTGEAAMDPLDHDSLVTCVDISQDERWVVTGTTGGKVSLWDVATGEKIAPSWQRESSVLNVSFHPVDDVLLIVWRDGLCRMYPLVPVNMPCEEWFLDFAESLAGRRFNERDLLEPVPAAEVRGWQNRISKQKGGERLRGFAEWLTAPVAERGGNPFEKK